nr:sigma-70 family RNA polymerase sigma factor [Actinomycetota bacterium]
MADGGVPTWESIARDHGRFIYNVAYRLTGNDDDAQDLVQEVLVRVRKGLGTYTPGSLEGWLARITTNAFLDEVRRRRRRPVDFLPDEPDRVVPPSRGADVVHEEENLSAGVTSALGELPPDFRAVVVMCDVVGMSYVEIGEALDVPVGTVRSRIHRGRAQLRKILG